MACQYENKLKDFLEENLPIKEQEKIENHLDTCINCQKKLDNLLENSFSISPETPEIEDEILIKKIKNRRKGIRRIILYAIIGFILGIFSRFYTMDKFIVTKAIMALPYKLGEFILSLFFSKNTLNYLDSPMYNILGNMGFFPYNPLLDTIASTITPAIVATFIAVMIAYLISDKTVFRRKKVISFILGCTLILFIWLGILGGIYKSSLNNITTLAPINGITVYKAEKNSTSWLIEIRGAAFKEKKFQDFREAISNAEKIGSNTYDDQKTGHILLLHFKGGAMINAFLDPDGTLTLHNGLTYKLSKEALKLFHTEILQEGSS